MGRRDDADVDGARLGLADHARNAPAWQRYAALLAQVGLYGLLFALPMLGLAASHAHAAPVRFLGLVLIPPLVQPDPDLADDLTDYHVWAAWALLFLVCVHAGAAAWHHWIRRDGVLTAMWPMHKTRR